MDILSLPQDAGRTLRQRLGLNAADPVRVSFIAGPGDVEGTYRHWSAGQNDPRGPIIVYSAMFYELMARLKAQAQIITFHAPTVDAGAHGFTFTHVRPRDWSGRLSYFRSKLRYGQDLVTAVQAYDPHVVLTHSDVPASAWPALGRGRKLILSAHNTFWPMGHPPQGAKAQLKLRILRRQAQALDGAICTSAECMRQLQQVTDGRITGQIEHPQIETAFRGPPKTQARKLLYLGRLEPNKGIFLLLAAFQRLKAAHPELTLSYAGSGSAQGGLAKEIAAANSPDLRFLGSLDSQQVHQQLMEADVLVCPTTTGFNEGLAVTGFEAAARGTPTVLSSVVPAQELLKDSCAVFRADDLNDLCRVLDGWITDESAYGRSVRALDSVHDNLFDRSLSWGSGLGRVLLQL